jgi:16S rRNA (cytosine967-C5)-methyltransferase
MLVPTARSVAATVIARVLRDRAFAAAALDAELERAIQLEPRDRALATELVYGTLRLFRWLEEERLQRFAKHDLARADPIVRAHLALAAYQLLVLTRVPAFAAVNEAVTNVRASGGKHVAGFVNAVLRKVAADARPTAEELSAAAVYAIEPTLRAALVRSIGEEGTAKLVTSGGAPMAGLRIEKREDRDAWLERLRTARPNATFEAGRVSPYAVLVRGAGRLDALPGYAEGAWTPQEEGSQLVALALGATTTDVVLDACAGRGNKTGLLAHRAMAVDAADVHPKKLDRLVRELARIGVVPRKTFAVDWSRGTGDASPSYDRVLVDAPCSGTGTLRRRPELALRRAGDDLAELAALQRAILGHAASLVKPGGRLIYAVCSVLREEAEDVVASVDLEPVPFDAGEAAAVAKDAPFLRLLPHEHGTDGYFIASLRKR